MRFWSFSSLRVLGIAVSMVVLSAVMGCSAISQRDETLTWSVQQLYNEAKREMSSGSMETSRKYYNKLLARYPFGRYAKQSQLDLIQLEYKDREYDKAVAQADKFLQVYPRSPYADYARYMKGVITYSRDVSIIDRLVPTNIAQSDQTLMKKAYENFQALVAHSPDGEYTADAKMRMRFLRNISAEHEIYVAEYYLRRKAYLAAANRGQFVLENYQTTPSAGLALAVLVRAYQELNLPVLSADAQRVLTANYPNIAAENPRAARILHGNIHAKPGFLSRVMQGLTN